MNRPLPARITRGPASFSPVSYGTQRPQTPLRSDGRPQRDKPLMRKYEVAYLAPNGDELLITRAAPAIPFFEEAFMALARGTLIATPEGPVAIEDIHPGMDVTTVGDGAQTVLWKGATTLVPDAPGQSEEACTLTRIAQDAMGLQRPGQDLLLGFGARLFQANQGRMVPARHRIDGDSIFAVRPQSPVRVFHLMLREHSCIIANGIEVETFHPGDTARYLRHPDVKSLYLSLFPHLDAATGFGPLRISREADAGSRLDYVA